MRFSRVLSVAAVFCLFVGLLAQAEPARRQNIGASVVRVTGEDVKGQPVAPGSGFFVSGDLIVTDYRVIKDAIRIHVQTAGEGAYDATIVAVDSSRSVALLSVPGTKIPALSLACPPEPAAESKLYVLENPGQADSPTTPVIVTRASKEGRFQPLRTDVAMGAEKGGSPLLNQQGEVTGIVVRSARADESATEVLPATYLLPIHGGMRACESNKPAAEISVGVPVPVPGGVPGDELVVGGAKAGDPAATKTVRKAGGVLAGSAIRTAQPRYPPLAKAARVSGSVVVEVTVDEAGDVLSARALSGHPLFKDSATAAAMGWKFTPTLLDGIAVKVVGTITFNFNL